MEYISLEKGELESLLICFTCLLESSDEGQPLKEVAHVYEVKIGKYPGVNNEILYTGGYVRVNVSDQPSIQLNELHAKTKEEALNEVVEKIKSNHSYVSKF